jgi:hypothetical protein
MNFIPLQKELSLPEPAMRLILSLSHRRIPYRGDSARIIPGK